MLAKARSASQALRLTACARHFGARRRRLSPAASSSSWALALLKPEDPNDGGAGFVNILNPFKAVRRGPELFAVTAIQQDADKAEVAARRAQSSDGQDKLRESFFWHFPSLARSEGQRGGQNATKLTPGALVVANFDMNVDPFMAGIFSLAHTSVAEEIMARNANLNQGYGKIVNVHHGSNGRVASVDVAFEGLWGEEYASAVHLHYHTETGFYANVHPDRLVAHASFRNIFLTTTAYDLRYEFALVWPHVLNFEEDLVFIDSITRQRFPFPQRAPYTVRQLIEGTVEIEIQKNRVAVLDPMSVLPAGLW